MAETITGAQVVNQAKKYLGDPYVWGAEGPSSFDCSGLIQYVFKQLGVTTPRTSETQYSWSRAKRISRSDLRPGDLVFANGASPGHVALYVGDNKVLHAPKPGTVVRYESMDTIGTLTGYRRFPNVKVSGSDTGTDTGGSGGATQVGLTDLPGDIIDFFKGAGEAIGNSIDFFTLLFQPTTYVRLASGFFGILFLIGAAVFLVREANSA